MSKEYTLLRDISQLTKLDLKENTSWQFEYFNPDQTLNIEAVR